MGQNDQTWTDDGVNGRRYYRHAADPVRSFEIVLNCGERANNLTIGTETGAHEINLTLRAHRYGRMESVLRVDGGVDQDGRLQVTVTDMLRNESWVLRP